MGALHGDRRHPLPAVQGYDRHRIIRRRGGPRRHVWIRRFDDEAHRAALYAATHDDPRWIDEIFPAVAGLLLLDRTVVTRAVPTPSSALH
jgi:hypothetical protein